jgi:hypothetical protein
MARCYNCGKPAMYLVGPEGKEVPLCLDCDLKHTQMLAIQNEQLEREMDFLTDYIESTTGVPRVLPRYLKRQTKIIQGGNVTLNNIHVSGSSVGVLNTGNLEMVDSAITILRQDPGTRDVSAAISKLANAVAQSEKLSADNKNEAMEILSTVATEATAPREKRRNIVVRRLLGLLPTAIQTAAAVLQVWHEVEPVITQYFR